MPGRIDLTAIEIREKHFGVVQFERIHSEDIAIQHDKVGALTGFQTSRRTLLFERERRVDCVCVEDRA